MAIVVRKYGGTSLSTLAQLRAVAESTAAARRAGTSVVVVVSARGSTTDALLTLAAEVCAPAGAADATATAAAQRAREVDQLLATGECASAALLALALTRLGVDAVSLTGGQAGIKAAGQHGAGEIKSIDAGPVMDLLKRGYVVVAAGFQGVNSRSDTMTLGRGGSDTTAVALAAALGARTCEIFTDVAGVYTADPRLVCTARKLDAVDVAAMAQLSLAGAKVVHPKAVEMAAAHGISLRVASSAGSEGGTMITNHHQGERRPTAGRVLAVTHDPDVVCVLVTGSGPAGRAAAVATAIADHCGQVEQMTPPGPGESEFQLGFTVRRADLSEVMLALHRQAADRGAGLLVDEDVEKVSLVGNGLLDMPDHAARMMSALASAGITAGWSLMSQLRMSVIVPRHRSLQAIETLHKEFALDGPPSLAYTGRYS